MHTIEYAPMFEKINKEDCCGCSACSNACPKQALSMKEDSEGFLYPYFEREKCIGCNMCQKVCPIINYSAIEKGLDDLVVYGGHMKSEQELRKSSSGGAFYAIAQRVIQQGGIVYGVRWDEDYKGASHFGTDSLDELQYMRESKYVQSDKNKVYSEIKDRLEKNTEQIVLFSGCPCEIGGLKSYLGKDYENLLTVEMICHGPTSPKASRLFVEELERVNNSRITKLSLRSKINYNWFPFTLRADFANGKMMEKEFFGTELGYAFSMMQRPSCYLCRFKEKRRVADFSLGDFYGADKKKAYYNTIGTSVITVNTKKAKDYLLDVSSAMVLEEVSFSLIEEHNKRFLSVWEENPKREEFSRILSKGGRKALIRAVRKTAGWKRYLQIKLSKRQWEFLTTMRNKVKRGN